jgi:SSS family transporter
MPLLATVARQGLTGLDYSLLVLYFIANLGIGWWCARRQAGSSAGYFLGGRKVLWWAAAVSFFATSTSSISFMALPAKTYQSDWMSFGSAPAQGFAGLLVGFVFVGLLRRLNLTTIYGYLDQRFNLHVRLLGAGLAVLLKLFGRMSVVMLLPALALSTVTGLNVYLSILLMGVVTTIYAMEGGFDAVIWTDFMQVIVTYGGVVVALYFLAGGVDGGLAGIVATGTDLGKFRMVSWEFSATEPTVWVFCGMFFGHIFTQLADQPLMQRMLASSDEREAKRTVVFGNLMGMLSSLVFFFIGTALYVFYRAHPERLDAALPNDAIFPYFIAHELPSGVVGLIVAGLFAAAMGAMSSTLNSIAAMVVTDFQLTFRPEAPQPQQVRLARGMTLVSGVIATGMAAYLAWRNVSSLWDEFLRLIALIGGGFPGVFALGFLTRRASSRGVIIGTLASIGVTWWVQNYTQTSVFLHSFVAIASCMVVGYLASLALPDPARRQSLAGLTLWDLRRDASRPA